MIRSVLLVCVCIAAGVAAMAARQGTSTEFRQSLRAVLFDGFGTAEGGERRAIGQPQLQDANRAKDGQVVHVRRWRRAAATLKPPAGLALAAGMTPGPLA